MAVCLLPMQILFVHPNYPAQFGPVIAHLAKRPDVQSVFVEENGLLADFFDVDGLPSLALRVLNEPQKYRHLGKAGRTLIEERYSIEKTLPKL